jgi:hypothetical protein
MMLGHVAAGKIGSTPFWNRAPPGVRPWRGAFPKRRWELAKRGMANGPGTALSTRTAYRPVWRYASASPWSFVMNLLDAREMIIGAQSRIMSIMLHGCASIRDPDRWRSAIFIHPETWHALIQCGLQEESDAAPWFQVIWSAWSHKRHSSGDFVEYPHSAWKTLIGIWINRRATIVDGSTLSATNAVIRMAWFLNQRQTFEGNDMSTIIDLLLTDHTYFKDVLGKLISSRSNADPDKIFRELSTHLTAHSHFEESSVYPLLTLHAATKEIAFEAFEEHQQIKVLLESLGRLGHGNSAFKAKLNVLNEDVVHHIIEEETKLFPQLLKFVPKSTLNILGITYQEILDSARFEIMNDRVNTLMRWPQISSRRSALQGKIDDDYANGCDTDENMSRSSSIPYRPIDELIINVFIVASGNHGRHGSAVRSATNALPGTWMMPESPDCDRSLVLHPSMPIERPTRWHCSLADPRMQLPNPGRNHLIWLKPHW